ncbi:MAG: N-acetylmuramoyl-L-alanine amidase [Ignavibacteriales bacterium]|nr:N-acetylmuramoyl-L-alanine amidase [Ignavibacteriales bacterium]
MHFHRYVSTLICLAILPVALLLSQTESSLPITVEGTPPSIVHVRAFVDDQVAYLCLNDLARELKIDTYANLVTQKFELKAENGILKVAGDNCFVETRQQKGKQESTNQLPLAVKFRDSLFYGPALYFLPLFNSISARLISVNPADVAAIERPIAAPPVLKFGITGVVFEARRNGIFVRIQTSKEFSDFSRFVKDNWLYITVSNAKADTALLNATLKSEAFSTIVVTQYPTSVQFSLQSKMKMTATNVSRDNSSTDLLATIETEPNPVLKNMISKESGEKAARQEKLLTQLKKQRTKWKLDVVVIDPGHGGYDPGTIGVIGTREKDVTLGIGLKLGKLIEQQMPDVKVIYTRKTDRFIELYRRGQIANENGGKLFISIHANSLPIKPSPVNGFEIYLLRPGKTDDAIKIAEKENAAVRLENDQGRYQEVTEENFIILTMAQSAYMKQSEHFAELLSDEMSLKMSPQGRGVKQAGFYVLVGASMPNVLVESGYLSNKNDEKFLRNPEGQQVVAESIVRTVQRYKRQYEQTLREDPADDHN